MLKNYGVDVTIVEFLPRALPNEDAEVSKEIEKQFKKLGVKILTGTKVESIEGRRRRRSYASRSARTARPRRSRPRRCCRPSASRPTSRATAWRRPGWQLTDRKAIGIDDYMRTNVPHIYAIGDVTGLLQLAHVAEAQGVVAAETIGGAETLALGDYRMMPRATFCQPQVASFGLTEEQARDEGYDVKVAKFPFTANAKAHGARRPERLRQADRRRQVRRAARRAPDRPRRVRTAARADAGAEVGSDRQRAGPQRPHPPDAVRSAAGVLPRPRRPHDQLLRADLGRRHRRIGGRPHPVAGRDFRCDRDARSSAPGCWSSPRCRGRRRRRRRVLGLARHTSGSRRCGRRSCGLCRSRRCCLSLTVLGVTYL